LKTCKTCHSECRAASISELAEALSEQKTCPEIAVALSGQKLALSVAEGVEGITEWDEGKAEGQVRSKIR